jgi:predicted amidophosphoribosyltransferase
MLTCWSIDTVVMQPKRGQSGTSSLFWECPVCGHFLGVLSRYTGWEPKACTRCGSLLGQNHKRRLLLWALHSAALFALLFFGRRVPIWIALSLYLGVSVAVFSLQRITIVGNRNNRFCPGCRYDLTGTLAAGIARCPECGHPLSAKNPPAARPVA